MPPKTPKQLREQIEAQQERPAAEGYEYTAEGMKVRTPGEGQLFSNLEKVARSTKNQSQ